MPRVATMVIAIASTIVGGCGGSTDVVADATGDATSAGDATVSTTAVTSESTQSGGDDPGSSTSTTTSAADSTGGCILGILGCPCDDGTCEAGSVCEADTCVEVDPNQCGDGMVAGDEECDAGADNGPGRACKADCTANVCGDADTGPGEGCDDGNSVDDDVCSNTCIAASCGDGTVQPGEACDDNNDDSTDMCTTACTLAACGDGVVQPGANEVCDEGLENGDTADCTSACQLAICGDGLVHSAGTGTEECDNGGAANGPGQACLPGCVLNVCGDGDVGPTEGCDDSNTVGGDSCSAVCQLEGCGNAITDIGEACDDGANGIDDDCTDLCTTPACGDGLLQPSIGEACDDGLANADSAACTLVCADATCGDGLVLALVEQCDNGVANADNAACKSDCTDQFCGDGAVGPLEGCDDANESNEDSCTNTCTAASCGDGFVQPGEACDEGGGNGGATCTISCVIPPCPCGFFHDTPTTCADAYPNIIFVSTLGIASDGQCWAQAFTRVEDALAVAGPDDELWIRQGTYRPGLLRTSTFTIPQGVEIYGGFAGNELTRDARNWITHRVYLSGDLANNGNVGVANADNAHHVVTIPAADGVIVDGVTIVGGHTSDAANTDGAGVNAEAGDLAFAHVVFDTNRAAMGDGAGVAFGSGTLSLSDCTFVQNIAGSGGGGGIYFSGAGEINATNSTFTANHGYQGGGIASVGGGTVSLVDCSFEDQTGAGGAGIFLQTGTLLMSGGSIDGSSVSTFEGGGISVTNATLSIHGTSFADNRASTGGGSLNGGGGAISAASSAVSITDSTFDGNDTVHNDGGAVWLHTSTGTIDGCSFVGNEAGVDSGANGGAIAVVGGGIEIVGSTFTANTAAAVGGAVYVSHSVVIRESLFTENSARYGGAAYSVFGSITMTDSELSANVGLFGGGAIFTGGGTLQLRNCDFVDNDAPSGGAVWASDSDPALMLVHDCGFYGNTAANYGAAVRVDSFDLHMANTVLSGNVASGVEANTGGALMVVDARAEIRNTSFTGNSSPSGGGAIGSTFGDIDIANSVLWDSSPAHLAALEPVAISITNSCVEGGYVGDGNLDPGDLPYVDADGIDDLSGTADDDLSLVDGSVCIDAGVAALLPPDLLDLDGDDDALEPLPVDRAGVARVIGPEVDMGAFEAP